MRTVLNFLIPVFIVGLILSFAAAENVTGQAKAPAGFVYIKGGTFMMGSPASEAERFDNEAQHRVTVSSFYMSKYEVTQKDYMEVIGANPSEFKGDNLPVENVSWYDAIQYCHMRSFKEGLTPAYNIDKINKDPNNKNEYDDEKWVITLNKNANGYRLPTEAEWEYACRAGATTPFSTGNNITTGQANYDGNYPYKDNADGINREKTTTAGSFKPNAWGLYDMHGNVSEWCRDWEGGYNTANQKDPVGPVFGSSRVMRGGDWGAGARVLRSASRGGLSPNDRSNNLGFRVVRQ